jgi:chemotaxis protein methyltransferase CheR
LFNALSPGGWLILGQAEALRARRDRWTTHIFPGAVAYQKPLTTTTQTTIWQTSPSPKVKNGKRDGVITPATPIKLNTTALYADAVELFRAENSDQAEMILMGVLADQPNHAAAHVLLACIFANRGDLREAHSHLDTALKLDSLQADAYYLRGVLSLEAGDDAAAVEALRSALYCRRGHPLAAMILGSLYSRKGESARARRTWKEAMDVIAGQPLTAPVCDLSDMTTESIMSFLGSQLESL